MVYCQACEQEQTLLLCLPRAPWRVAHVLAMRGLLEAAATIREEGRHWTHGDHCGQAAVIGVLDRLCMDEHAITPALRDVLVQAIDDEPDGFALMWQARFGQPLDNAKWLAEQREQDRIDATPLVDAQCIDCGVAIRLPVERSLDREMCRCQKHMAAALGESLARIAARLNGD